MKSIVQFFAAFCLVLGLAGAASASSEALDAAPQVNINQASAEELAEALTGVGVSRAQAIVRSRDSDGPFQSADGLSRVKGIGETTVEKNRQRIQVE